MNAARKQCRKQALEYILYIQYICAHSCTFEALAFIDIKSLGLQLSTKFHCKKKTRRLKIRDTTFWACFRQDLDLNVQSPSFSAVFPPFSAVFPALLRRFLSSEFSVFPCFSWFTFVFSHDKQFLSYSLPLPFGNMLQMPKSNKQFQWDSILWAMTVLLTDFSHAAATPPVLSDLHYWDLELDLAKALRSQILKSKKCPLSFTHPRTI